MKTAKDVVDILISGMHGQMSWKISDLDAIDFMSKECTLIAIDTVLAKIEADIDSSQGGVSYHQNLVDLGFWREAKNEIENRIKNSNEISKGKIRGII